MEWGTTVGLWYTGLCCLFTMPVFSLVAVLIILFRFKEKKLLWFILYTSLGFGILCFLSLIFFFFGDLAAYFTGESWKDLLYDGLLILIFSLSPGSFLACIIVIPIYTIVRLLSKNQIDDSIESPD